MPQKTINKTELDKLARLGSQAALYSYETTRKVLIAENVKAQKLNKPYSFFIKPADITASQIYKHAHYQAFKQGEAHIKQKDIFLNKLFDVIKELNEQDDDDLLEAKRRSIQQVYDDICRSNRGDIPIFDVFSSQLIQVLGNPKVHPNTTNLQKAIYGTFFLCGALMLTAAILSSTVSFGVISPLLMCAYASGFLALALRITDIFVRSCENKKDHLKLPVNMISPAEIVNSDEGVYEKNNLVGQPIRLI